MKRARSGDTPSRLLLGALSVTALLLGSASAARGQGYLLWQFNVSPGSTNYGFSVAGAGDVNGDGFDDLIVGGEISTQAKVFSGATGAVLLTLNMAGPVASVARAGDVNGDGVSDLVVGAPGLFNIPLAGEVKVFSGSNGNVLLTFSGTGTDRFGASVAGAGDVDLDGVPDVIAGAAGGILQFFPGYAKVFSGSTGGILFTFIGAPGERLGWSVAGAGDVNGDGAADLIAGAPFANGAIGEARVFSGSTGALLWTFSGSGLPGRFGTSVSSAGDVNGDGSADVLVGEPGPGGPFPPVPGQAVIFSGAAGSVLRNFNGTLAADAFGGSVAAAGDLDGDGVPEALVGAPWAGPSIGTGYAKVFSGSTGSPLFTFNNPATGGLFGSTVSGAGDVNRDGFPDLIVGSPLPGQARVFSVVGIPTGSSLYGAGCAGTGGFVPKMSTFGGSPSPGNSAFGFAVSKALGGSQGFLFLGTAPDIPGSPLGGCTQLLAGLIFLLDPPVALSGPSGMGGAGRRLKGVPIPALPSLLGLVVYLHWAIPDPASPNALFTTSDALSLMIL